MIRALGMMSGTSMDGVDAALIDTDGSDIAGFGRSGFLPVSDNEAAILDAARGLWPGDPGVAHAAAHSHTTQFVLHSAPDSNRKTHKAYAEPRAASRDLSGAGRCGRL